MGRNHSVYFDNIEDYSDTEHTTSHSTSAGTTAASASSAAVGGSGGAPAIASTADANKDKNNKDKSEDKSNKAPSVTVASIASAPDILIPASTEAPVSRLLDLLEIRNSSATLTRSVGEGFQAQNNMLYSVGMVLPVGVLGIIYSYATASDIITFSLSPNPAFLNWVNRDYDAQESLRVYFTEEPKSAAEPKLTAEGDDQSNAAAMLAQRALQDIANKKVLTELQKKHLASRYFKEQLERLKPSSITNAASTEKATNVFEAIRTTGSRIDRLISPDPNINIFAYSGIERGNRIRTAVELGYPVEDLMGDWFSETHLDVLQERETISNRRKVLQQEIQGWGNEKKNLKEEIERLNVASTGSSSLLDARRSDELLSHSKKTKVIDISIEAVQKELDNLEEVAFEQIKGFDKKRVELMRIIGFSRNMPGRYISSEAINYLRRPEFASKSKAEKAVLLEEIKDFNYEQLKGLNLGFTSADVQSKWFSREHIFALEPCNSKPAPAVEDIRGLNGQQLELFKTGQVSREVILASSQSPTVRQIEAVKHGVPFSSVQGLTDIEVQLVRGGARHALLRQVKARQQFEYQDLHNFAILAYGYKFDDIATYNEVQLGFLLCGESPPAANQNDTCLTNVQRWLLQSSLSKFLPKLKMSDILQFKVKISDHDLDCFLNPNSENDQLLGLSREQFKKVLEAGVSIVDIEKVGPNYFLVEKYKLTMQDAIGCKYPRATADLLGRGYKWEDIKDLKLEDNVHYALQAGRFTKEEIHSAAFTQCLQFIKSLSGRLFWFRENPVSHWKDKNIFEMLFTLTPNQFILLKNEIQGLSLEKILACKYEVQSLDTIVVHSGLSYDITQLFTVENMREMSNKPLCELIKMLPPAAATPATGTADKKVSKDNCGTQLGSALTSAGSAATAAVIFSGDKTAASIAPTSAQSASVDLNHKTAELAKGNSSMVKQPGV